ncbi:hypothetical protein Bpfe_030005, partial [Biomphalaria pfeifferi]
MSRTQNWKHVPLRFLLVVDRSDTTRQKDKTLRQREKWTKGGRFVTLVLAGGSSHYHK